MFSADPFRLIGQRQIACARVASDSHLIGKTQYLTGKLTGNAPESDDTSSNIGGKHRMTTPAVDGGFRAGRSANRTGFYSD